MSLYINEINILDMTFSERVSIEEFRQWLVHIQQYLENGKKFILIMQTDMDTEFPEEYRILQGEWYKRYKQDFYQFCLGLARIAQDETDRIRLDTPALQKAWQVPYFVCLEKNDAMQWAMQRYI